MNRESEMKVHIKKWELEKAEYQLPYDGAKEMLLVEEIDNRGFKKNCLRQCMKNCPSRNVGKDEDT